MPSLEIFSASIISLGAFNPPLVSLDWFQQNGLVGAGDAEAARIRDDFFTARQVSRFRTDLAEVQAIGNQLSVAATGPVSPAIADLASGIFDLLPHTPVSAVGINFVAHYRTENLDTYHRVGDVLAPKQIWESLFPEAIAGLADLTVLIENGTREASSAGLNNKRITLQPSTKVRPGLFLQINNHFGADVDGQPLTRARAAAAVIRSNWETCHAKSRELLDRIIQATLEQPEQRSVHR